MTSSSPRTGLAAVAAGVLCASAVAGCAQRPATPGMAPSVAPTVGPSPSATANPAPRQATVVMTGDLLWHNTLWFGARDDAARAGRSGSDEMDFLPTLAAVEPLVASADLAICHNEVPIAPAGGPYHGYPAFSAPPQTLTAVRQLGYDLCTTASNHSLDRGADGLRRTLDRMDATQLLHVGTARSQREAETPVIFTTPDGVRIAVVTGAYGTNGIPLPQGQPWAWSGLDPEQLLERARASRAAGADIVLAAIHAGDEYQPRPNDQQTRLATILTASPDVDLVYGHHAHAVQPITRVNGKWVAYGLGNLVAQHRSKVPRGQEGIATRFTFVESPDGRFRVQSAEYFPTFTTPYAAGRPARLLLVNDALARGEGDAERLQAARQRTTEAVNLLGAQAGLHQG
ncbi:CapA family protein [Luteococcus sp. Sow4_B9]|uniref:CapA family protein n=1 Tax=Luteococcus sp. Sow4_B9 TaxID=3438792 RepID=UPI003F965AB1